ncbi:transporter substrate-binding domain-containing protein [Duganella sp. LX20W]|uniref:Transporter substrate-binding domain-containing protein n=1 Tax=Rugamonas brunnea TaxID=2758569 RepID=A0A7W2EX86_9BURK|nr:transporter substrate-binding domain-containing protein [Rugamonas brunnea]MBA5640299.1 transporter substrate-binding domain-containing protein [Rugamonas brunnea]
MKSLLTLLAALLFALPGAAAPRLVLNTSFFAPITSPEHDGALDLLYAELFRRVGLDVVIQPASAERGLLNANSGIDDGDVSRVLGIEQSYTNLVRVPEPVMTYQMAVFTRHADFTVDGPASLRPYDVGILRGWKILERSITGTRSLQKLETGRQLFAMLAMDRIDVAVIEKLEGLHFIQSMGLQGVRILAPAYVEGEWFLYLHKKHAALAPRLAEQLRLMKRDGSYQRLFDQALRGTPR